MNVPPNKDLEDICRQNRTWQRESSCWTLQWPLIKSDWWSLRLSSQFLFSDDDWDLHGEWISGWVNLWLSEMPGQKRRGKKTMATAASSSWFYAPLEAIFRRNVFDIRFETGFTVAFRGITGLAEKLECGRAQKGVSISAHIWISWTDMDWMEIIVLTFSWMRWTERPISPSFSLPFSSNEPDCIFLILVDPFILFIATTEQLRVKV